MTNDRNRLDPLSYPTRSLVYSNGQVAIHPRFNKLITALRTAVENGEGVLGKEATSHDDLLDGFRMSLQYWATSPSTDSLQYWVSN